MNIKADQANKKTKNQSAQEPDNKPPATTKSASLHTSDITFLIENEVLQMDLKDNMFNVNTRPYMTIPHCEGVYMKDMAGLPTYDRMEIDNGVVRMYNLTNKGSETLCAELQRLCRIVHGQTSINTHLKEAISAFQGDANLNKKTAVNRVQYLDKALYYDFMLERDNKIAKITKDGWEIIDIKGMLNPDNNQFVFMRYSHQLPQVLPSSTPNIELLDRYYDLQDDDRTFLMVVDTITGFFPHLQQPIKQLSGESGAGKTFRGRVMSNLIDPDTRSKGITINKRLKLDQFVRILYQGYFVFFDNVSDLSKEMNDILAKVVTGLNYTAKKLYTDDDMLDYPDFIRPVVLNGIVTKGTESDVLDRTNLFHVKAPLKREDDNDLAEMFENDKPHIMAAIFDILSKAMGYIDEIKREIKIPEEVRLRDYVVHCCAVTKAMGHDPNKFMKIYLKTFEERDYEAIESNPLGAVLIQLMGVEPSFQGTPDELLSRLQLFIQNRAITVGFGFPHDAKSLGENIAKIKKNLKAVGINYASTRVNGVRTYVLGNTRYQHDPKQKPVDISESSHFIKTDGM